MTGDDADELPEGWATAAFGELLKPNGLFDGPFGSSLKSSDYRTSGVRVIRLENVANLRFVAEKGCFISPEKYAGLTKHTVRAGDIIVGSFLDGAPRVCVLPELETHAIAKADCFCVRPDTTLIDRTFLAYQIGATQTHDHLVGEIHGATRPRITTKQLRLLPVLLPPLAEQRRIVAAVEGLLAAVSSARARLDRVPAMLKRFRQSVLAAACSGRLTVGVTLCPIGELGHGAEQSSQDAELLVASGLESLPVDWKLSPLDDLRDTSRPISYGVLKPGPYTEAGIPLLRIVDIAGGIASVEDAHRITADLSQQYRRTVLQGGEVLVSLVGTIGRIALVPTNCHGANVHRNLAVVASSATVDQHYLAMALKSPCVQKQIEHVTIGASQPLFNLGDLKRMMVPLPPRAEQVEIVRRVSALFAHADALEQRATVARRRVEGLTQAVLAKAFRGELVPTEAELARRDGRTYEPAADLLARIRAATPAAPKPRRGRKPTP